MTIHFQTLKVLGFLFTAGLISSQVIAQTASATASTNAVIIKPITLTKVSDLSFGRLASVAGVVSIAPDSGSRSSTVAANLITANGTSTSPSRASFTVGGENSLTYSISAPATTILLTSTTSSAHQLTVTLTGVYAASTSTTASVATASTGTLSSSGADTLGIGGSLTLTDTTYSGTYTNTAGISLIVNYN